MKEKESSMMQRREYKKKVFGGFALIAIFGIILLLNQLFGFGLSHLLTMLFALFLSAFMGFILWSAYKDKDPKNDFERWKNIIEILAILAAGVFFSIQFLNGWTSTNMSIHLKTERYSCDEKSDCVAVQVELEKGEYGALKLYGGEVRAIDPDSQKLVEGSEVKPLAGTQRMVYDSTRNKIDWDHVDSKKYRIASYDKLQFAAVLKVPKGKTCIIEAAVITYADLWLPGRGPAQSRSSVVSIPPK
jgi:hypothetical protein